MQSGQKIKKDRKNTKGKIPLTIYLPDKVTSMMVYASQSANIGDLIEQILEEHEEDHLDPPLDYANPQNYEILVHDCKISSLIIILFYFNLMNISS